MVEYDTLRAACLCDGFDKLLLVSVPLLDEPVSHGFGRGAAAVGARRCSIDENSAAMAQMAPDEHKPPHPLLTSLPAARPGHENCLQDDKKALLLSDAAKCMHAMRSRRDDRGPLGTHIDEIEPAYVAAALALICGYFRKKNGSPHVLNAARAFGRADVFQPVVTKKIELLRRLEAVLETECADGAELPPPLTSPLSPLLPPQPDRDPAPPASPPPAAPPLQTTVDDPTPEDLAELGLPPLTAIPVDPSLRAPPADQPRPVRASPPAPADEAVHARRADDGLPRGLPAKFKCAFAVTDAYNKLCKWSDELPESFPEHDAWGDRPEDQDSDDDYAARAAARAAAYFQEPELLLERQRQRLQLERQEPLSPPEPPPEPPPGPQKDPPGYYPLPWSIATEQAAIAVSKEAAGGREAAEGRERAAEPVQS